MIPVTLWEQGYCGNREETEGWPGAGWMETEQTDLEDFQDSWKLFYKIPNW